jgi:hypothetical protein
MKAQLRYIAAIQSPLLWSSMRIQNALVVFKARTDREGNIACLHAMSGHPIIIAVAMDSLKLWKFRPKRVNGQPRPIYGTLVLRISCCKRGLESKLVNNVPPQPKQ